MRRKFSNALIIGVLGVPWFASPVFSQQIDKPIGSAWEDSRNPVSQLWDGQRLDLWTLKPPASPTVPNFTDTDWVHTPVDCFILEKLRSAGHRPSMQADRKTLIRRVTFDLIGLPPTPAEVNAFELDEAPDAYELLLDRLLSSPEYGMRWGRHWLDVVRYADTNGFERDEFRTTMWKYRDYVVHSFNEDLPYDQFILEQIAGDEMASTESVNPRRELQHTATGYLRLGPLDTTKSKFDTEEAGRDEWMVDLTNTTGSAFLGQTLGCCRCHDHKTDPLLQVDHYRLRAYFAGIESDDEKIIDSPDEGAAIASHNSDIEARLKPLQEEYEKALQPGKQRLIARTLSSFPAEIVSLLKQSRDKLDSSLSEKIAPYLKKLDFYDEDVAAQLTEAEKPAYQAALRRVEALEKQKRQHTTVYCAKEKASDIPRTYILEGGVFTDRREEVQPGIFSLLDPNQAGIMPPKQGSAAGRRTALARWIASTRNPWTARVMVNRIWHHHFGKGIVASPDDFGYSGQPPTHPELLDWLAIEFMQSDWSIKRIHRLIMLSSTYRQSSVVDSQSLEADPSNRFFSRQNMRRMDAEVIRDSILEIAGMLERVDGGSPRWPEVPESVLRAQPGIFENSGRLQAYYTDADALTFVRSILLVRKRSVPLPFLAVFNLSDASGTCGRREVTNNAPQALSLLNNPLSILAASYFATRLTSANPDRFNDQMNNAFWLAFGREVTAEELSQLHQSWRSLCTQLTQGSEGERDSSAEPRSETQSGKYATVECTALAELCRAILNSNEFIFIE